MDVYNLKGRRIVLTGGGGDIGLATLRVLLQGGAHVHVVDPRPDLDSRLAEPMRLAPGRVTCWRSALDSPAMCREALQGAGGPVFALVHLAGLYEQDPLLPDRPEFWRRAIDTNLKSAYDLSVAFRAFASPNLTCRIIYTSSVSAGRGSPDHAAYSASKAGLLGLTRSLSRKFAPSILVNAVAPGIVTTSMTTDLIQARGGDGVREIALGRYGAPEDIAGVFGFMCSDSARYITGQVIEVDGGVVFR